MGSSKMSGSYLIVSEEKSDSLFPVYFGVSCAVFALKLLKGPEKEDEIRDKMLRGSAQLLGLLVWRIQKVSMEEKFQLVRKVETAEKEIEELRKRRHEDAKANEKVVGIFASQEQCWLNERKRLRHQIAALMNKLRGVEKEKEESVAELDEKMHEMELVLQSKDKAIEEAEEKMKELEELVKKSERECEETREMAKKEAREHSTELWKHKTSFIELVSNQRRLEAELGRSLRLLESTKLELNSVMDQKEESELLAQKLSIEISKMSKDLEQKDRILSAMLRKSKLDNEEKQMLLKESKLSKAAKKQADLETERKAGYGSRNERHSLKNMFSSQANKSARKTKSKSNDLVFSFEHLELKRNLDAFSPLVELDDVKRLESWVRSEAEKCAAVMEKRHHLELDAFSEQMRIKDEKLENCHWKLLSRELESKRLQSYVEALNQDMSQLRHNNIKLETLLLQREEELNSLKEKALSQKMKSLSSSLNDPELVTHDVVWSKDKIMKRKPVEKEQDSKSTPQQIIQDADSESKNVKSIVLLSPENEFEEKKQVVNAEQLVSISEDASKTSNPLWRMDLQALGVSYKIKRIKQQLLLLERLTGKQESAQDQESSNNGTKNFLSLMSLLNKQVSRYQSLQAKVDDLCKRMRDNNLDGSTNTRLKEDNKTLEQFLEETFQLQRYMVATGQKLMEVQIKISSGFVGVELDDKSASFDAKRFSDSIGSLFQEVQRGLEVRIAQIIGELEGTLACEGMIQLRR